jgi:hypothetical protein
VKKSNQKSISKPAYYLEWVLPLRCMQGILGGKGQGMAEGQRKGWEGWVGHIPAGWDYILTAISPSQ